MLRPGPQPASARAAPAEVVRAARFYMAAQVETGHLCPITMTRAALAALAAAPELAAKIVPKVVTRNYDAVVPAVVGKSRHDARHGHDRKTGRHRRARQHHDRDARRRRLFDRRPQMVLLRADERCLSGAGAGAGRAHLFSDAALSARRLGQCAALPAAKDKLGNRSNASSEVEFTDAFAWRVGDEGAGIRTILQMVQLTRLDCAVASAGLMRMALAQAVHHCRHRNVFQKPLYDQPMMRAVLADMALEVEGAVALVMRLCARARPRRRAMPREAAYARLMTPAAKYWICKLAPAFVLTKRWNASAATATSRKASLPRLYREAPVNAIWEGSGNVMCLDVLRALKREEDAEFLRCADARCRPAGAEAAAFARRPSEATARAAVGTLGAGRRVSAALKSKRPAAVAEAFVRTRLESRMVRSTARRRSTPRQPNCCCSALCRR